MKQVYCTHCIHILFDDKNHPLCELGRDNNFSNPCFCEDHKTNGEIRVILDKTLNSSKKVVYFCQKCRRPISFKKYKPLKIDDTTQISCPVCGDNINLKNSITVN